MIKHCTAGNVIDRIGCILDYNGNFQDVGINYVVFFINLAACVFAIQLHTRDIEKANKLRNFALASLLSVIAFQILLCLMVGCMGISIVWCGMCGWIISERRRLEESSDDMELARLRRQSLTAERCVIVLNVAAIGYYWLRLPFLTTIAHLCSLILGAILSSVSIKLYDEGSSEDMVETTTPSTPLMETS